MRIALNRPLQSNLARLLQLQPLHPLATIRLILTTPDLLGQRIRPLLGRGKRLPADAAVLPVRDDLLGDARVPDMMQVEPLLVKKHRYPVPALLHVLCVQRLVDVAHKVNDELGRLSALDHVQRLVQQARGVVLDGAHHAPLGFAIALVDDAARVRGRILGVDVVQGPRPPTPFGVPDRIGPGGYIGKVVGGVVAQEGLEIGGGGVGDEVACEVGDGDVSEACFRAGGVSVLVMFQVTAIPLSLIS